MYCHKALLKFSTPLLLAPTGKATRRLSEVTGEQSLTVHLAVGYKGEETCSVGRGYLESNLIIVDEASMLDLHITSLLFSKVACNSKIVFIGDPEQLPSVGAGNVLFDLLRSNKVPTVRLDCIFRQKDGNSIVTNASEILQGNTELIFTKDFCMEEIDDTKTLFQRACEKYQKLAQEIGADNVVLLNPYREKGELNVISFNKYIQDRINPIREGEAFVKSNYNLRVGDRVMQKKNSEFAKNGDVGIIKYIKKDGEDIKIIAEFNENLVTYSEDRFSELDLAYCTTVHKSQGSEYDAVIMVLSKEHKTMLKRNIIYTAITRAKKRVYLFCDNKKTLDIAISNKSKDMRYSLLADRLQN